MAQSGKPLHPQLDQHNTKELNLTVLQRMDRYVEDILTTAGHVTLFQFDTVTQQWVRFLFSFLFLFFSWMSVSSVLVRSMAQFEAYRRGVGDMTYCRGVVCMRRESGLDRGRECFLGLMVCSDSMPVKW